MPSRRMRQRSITRRRHVCRANPAQHAGHRQGIQIWRGLHRHARLHCRCPDCAHPSHRRCNDQSSQHCVCFCDGKQLPPCCGQTGNGGGSSRPMGRTRVGRTSTARRQSSAPTPTPSMAVCSRQALTLTLPATPCLVTQACLQQIKAFQPASLDRNGSNIMALLKHDAGCGTAAFSPRLRRRHARLRCSEVTP